MCPSRLRVTLTDTGTNERRRHEMYHHNPSEVWRERQLALAREAEHRRLVRLGRKGRSLASAAPASGRKMSALGRVISLWGRTAIPFFRS
jgi:hypothetical protein